MKTLVQVIVMPKTETVWSTDSDMWTGDMFIDIVDEGSENVSSVS
jgi:hypothetical protein